jgi:hypothetical protein
MTISVFQCAQPNIPEYLNLQQPEMSHQTPWSHYIHLYVEACKRNFVIVLHKCCEFRGNCHSIGVASTTPDILLWPLSRCTFRSIIHGTLQSDEQHENVDSCLLCCSCSQRWKLTLSEQDVKMEYTFLR